MEEKEASTLVLAETSSASVENSEESSSKEPACDPAIPL